MKLQYKILSTFKKNYPDLSYKQISKLTGIEKSRIFRIFNGSELKITELEIIDNFNQEANSPGNIEFIETAKQCLTTLNRKILNKLLLEMQYTLTSSQLCH